MYALVAIIIYIYSAATGTYEAGTKAHAGGCSPGPWPGPCSPHGPLSREGPGGGPPAAGPSERAQQIGRGRPRRRPRR